MHKHILAVCDREEDYIRHFLNYFSQPALRTTFPFEVRACTDPKNLRGIAEERELDLLLLSSAFSDNEAPGGSGYGAYLPQANRLLVLCESEKTIYGPDEVGKYQPMEAIMRRILEIAAESDLLEPMFNPLQSSHTRFIGVYSPVGRSLQTSFSFTLGQLLAEKQKVLYLNLEYCSGLGQMLKRDFHSDLADLIYYLHNADGRFLYRLDGTAVKIGGMDMIPPVLSGVDLMQVEAEEWIKLMNELSAMDRYDWIILDLSEAVRGLFEILRRCAKVYTILREDNFALAKQAQYEEMLRGMELEEVLEHTDYCRFPLFRSLPPGLEGLTRSELAEYIRQLVPELADQKMET